MFLFLWLYLKKMCVLVVSSFFYKLDEVVFILGGMVRIGIGDGFRRRFVPPAGVFSYSMEVEKM